MIKRELATFLIVGGLTVLVDFLCYRALIGFDVFDTNMAKATGFLIGTLFAYFANRFWTFGHKPHIPGSAWRFVALYLCTLGANVLVNSYTLKILNNPIKTMQAAFFLATAVSAVLNFIGMKYFVFGRRK